jgi:hypothetical protein
VMRAVSAILRADSAEVALAALAVQRGEYPL